MSDMLTQEQIEAMMAGGGSAAASAPADSGSAETSDMDNLLTLDEKDVLGEVGNICMGTSATTMYTLLGHRVSITTPEVHVFSREAILSAYKRPYVVIEVNYTKGVTGNNLLMLSEDDAMVITDILMGGEGIADPDQEFGELQLSAMGEVMNQMVGSASISLANLLHETIDIAPPRAIMVDFSADEPSEIMEEDVPYVKINFDMEIEGILKSKLMQIMPIDYAQKLVKRIMDMEETGELTESASPAPLAAAAAASVAAAPPPAAAAPPPPVPQSQASAPPPPMMAPSAAFAQSPVDVQTAHFQSFDAGMPAYTPGTENINRIIDVPLQVTVELGKTKKSIREVLDFSSGSIVVLDKLAGEHVEVLVNGKLVARGEVVVIEESYGVRITEIISQPMLVY